MRVFKFLLIVFLFCSSVSRGQLADFGLQVVATDETCLSNGSLTFTTTNLTPGSEVIYKVYLLPNTSSPISISVDNYLGGLSAGTYKVEVLQALGEFSNSQQQQVVINENITPFDFSVSSSEQNCSGGGDIIVNVTSGTASGYEIISGTEVRSLQTSNVFSGLPSGTYNVRAFNNCGVGVVRTYILSIEASELTISGPSYSDDPVTICDSIVVNHVINASSGTIGYPISVHYRLNTLDIDGNEMVIDQTFANGPEDQLEISAVMPRYMQNSYDYDIEVTDNCNAVFESNDNVVDPSLELSLTTSDAPCADKYLLVDVGRFYNSFTLEFLSVPEGFNPVSYNSNVNSSFTNGHIEFGSPSNPVPFGNYVVEITDECGRVATKSIMIELEIPAPNIAARNNGCFSEFGRIRLNVTDTDLVSAIIIAAPDTYENALPQDVTSSINGVSTLVLNDLPIGLYTIQFTDECGFFREETIEVPPFVERNFTESTLPSCEAGFGSVLLRSRNGDLTDVIITSAPAALNQSLPYNASFNIASGRFYMGDLPQGNYTFQATDICGIMHDMVVDIEGYNPPSENSFEFTPNCGSFSVKVTDESNGIEGANYWLQMLDEETGNWVHPRTGVVYTEGSIPNDETGIKFRNDKRRNNLKFEGTFRMLKKFETYSSGSSENTICISELGQFEYNDEFSVGSAFTLACVGEPNDVYIEAVGYNLTYKIIKKDGEPFTIDNGDSNIFENLEPAVYVFSVEDDCGNIITQWLNFQELPSIAEALQPKDMLVCGEPGGLRINEFHLTTQNEQILGPLYSAMYTITYHLTQEDADNAVNPLPEYYTNLTNGQTIYVRLIHNEIDLCYSTTSFKLFVGDYQEPRIVTTGTVCDDIELMLTADAGYSSYLWSNGETTRSIFVTEPGTYSVIVEKAYGTEMCDGFTEIEIKASEKPEIVKIETKDWTEDNNTITVYVDGNGTYEYSVDGVSYQESNVFENLPVGIYDVFVRDASGCGKDKQEVVLMYYPKYFTPNGDGVNEKWYIKHAITEPNFEVSIYDRYGKHITTLSSTSDGWDGTLQGAALPSTDYWFVAVREDGREFRGHFSMVR